jgi:UDP-N-acetylmuramate dehydrogenase
MSRLQTLKSAGLEQAVPLAKYTAARLGGAADWLYVARESLEQLADVVQAAWDDQLPVRVLGGGANVLVSDAGFRGLVVINHVAQIEFGDWHDGRNLAVTSGTGLLRLAREAAAHGLAGMEWAIGVPGTLGGAIVNNAGAHGSDMGHSIGDVVVLDARAGAQLYSQAELDFSYRHSLLKARQDREFLVLMATLCLEQDDPQAIRERMESYNAYRKRTQPPGASLGSIFKNPAGDYAGRLIEACGLKGTAIGGVQVSPIHANFIVHAGNASASDYYRLIQLVQETVEREQGIRLELEVELLGF